MKITSKTILLFVLFGGAFSAIAQIPIPDYPLPAAPGTGLLMTVIPLLVPILIAVGKWELPKVPRWILPVVAPILGALIDWLGSLAMGSAASPVMAAALGSAGVGVREIYDQVKWKISQPDAPVTPVPPDQIPIPPITSKP